MPTPEAKRGDCCSQSAVSAMRASKPPSRWGREEGGGACLHDRLQKRDWRGRRPTGSGGPEYLRGTKREPPRGGWWKRGAAADMFQGADGQAAEAGSRCADRCWVLGPGCARSRSHWRAGDPTDAVGVARSFPRGY